MHKTVILCVYIINCAHSHMYMDSLEELKRQHAASFRLAAQERSINPKHFNPFMQYVGQKVYPGGDETYALSTKPPPNPFPTYEKSKGTPSRGMEAYWHGRNTDPEDDVSIQKLNIFRNSKHASELSEFLPYSSMKKSPQALELEKNLRGFQNEQSMQLTSGPAQLPQQLAMKKAFERELSLEKYGKTPEQIAFEIAYKKEMNITGIPETKQQPEKLTPQINTPNQDKLIRNLDKNPSPFGEIAIDDKSKDLPVKDDFGAPIKWVRFNSNETEDGLAKVTDPKTLTNYQHLVNGTVFVPVIDKSLQRLGITTSTKPPPPKPNEHKTAIRTVLRNVDVQNPNQDDWLAFEVVIGGNLIFPPQCRGPACNARCKTLGCESRCVGDTCVSGCVGASCSSYCEEPGCSSMCIGEDCLARCRGMNCQARCRGENCETNCKGLSCSFITNGNRKRSTETWDQHYP